MLKDWCLEDEAAKAEDAPARRGVIRYVYLAVDMTAAEGSASDADLAEIQLLDGTGIVSCRLHPVAWSEQMLYYSFLICLEFVENSEGTGVKLATCKDHLDLARPWFFLGI